VERRTGINPWMFLVIAILVVAMSNMAGMLILLSSIKDLHHDVLILHQNQQEMDDIREQELMEAIRGRQR